MLATNTHENTGTKYFRMFILRIYPWILSRMRLRPLNYNIYLIIIIYNYNIKHTLMVSCFGGEIKLAHFSSRNTKTQISDFCITCPLFKIRHWGAISLNLCSVVQNRMEQEVKTGHGHHNREF